MTRNVHVLQKVLESGFIDTFRYFYPDKEGIYSWCRLPRPGGEGTRGAVICRAQGLAGDVGEDEREIGAGMVSRSRAFLKGFGRQFHPRADPGC